MLINFKLKFVNQKCVWICNALVILALLTNTSILGSTNALVILALLTNTSILRSTNALVILALLTNTSILGSTKHDLNLGTGCIYSFSSCLNQRNSLCSGTLIRKLRCHVNEHSSLLIMLPLTDFYQVSIFHFWFYLIAFHLIM